MRFIVNRLVIVFFLGISGDCALALINWLYDHTGFAIGTTSIVYLLILLISVVIINVPLRADQKFAPISSLCSSPL